jgi:hypothetical protein
MLLRKSSYPTRIDYSSKHFSIFFTDKTLGNTGGMGGVFGPLYCIGKGFPFPEAKPYSPSWQFRAFSAFGNLAGKIAKLTGKK